MFEETLHPLQGKYYKQLEGAAMGSPMSSIVASLFMESFETRALSTCKEADSHQYISAAEQPLCHFCQIYYD